MTRLTKRQKKRDVLEIVTEKNAGGQVYLGKR